MLLLETTSTDHPLLGSASLDVTSPIVPDRLRDAASDIALPDYSEFQPNVNWAQLPAFNGGAAIIRALYGTGHVDNAWYGGARRADFWAKNPNGALGIYQYLVANQDAAAQAAALVSLVRTLRPGEVLICDQEEGQGDQLPRFQAWKEVVDANLGYDGYCGGALYTGLNFAQTRNLVPVFNDPHTLSWVAAYGQGEPALRHDLWQFTDALVTPMWGAPADASIYHGSAAALRARVCGGSNPTPPAPPVPVPPSPPAHVVDRARIKLIQSHLGDTWTAAPLVQDGFWGAATDNSALAVRSGLVGNRDATIVLQRAIEVRPVDGVWGNQSQAVYTTTVKNIQQVLGVIADGAWGPITDRAFMGLRAASLNQ